MKENVLNALVTPIALLKQHLGAQKALVSHARIRINALLFLPRLFVIVFQESVLNVFKMIIVIVLQQLNVQAAISVSHVQIRITVHIYL